jgi:hypothetical protein
MGLNAIAHVHASKPGEMWLCATKEYQFDVLESAQLNPVRYVGGQLI